MLLPDTVGLIAKKTVASLVADLDVAPMQVREAHMGPPMPPTQDPITIAAQCKQRQHL